MSVRFLLLVGLCGGAGGCGRAENRLHGTVTLDGRPLEQGFVTFFPVDSPASTWGAEVRGGRYEVKDVTLTPGPRRAVVSVRPDASAVVRPDGTTTLRFAGPLLVTPQTPGNQGVVEVSGGEQEFDVALHSPPPARR